MRAVCPAQPQAPGGTRTVEPTAFSSRPCSLGARGYLSMRSDTEPTFPPAAALMVTVPSFFPVTRPVLLTVARLVFELVQVKVTPAMTRSLES